MNFLAVLVATLVIFFTSFLWFNNKTFFPVWWRAIGKEGDPGAGNLSMGALFGSTFIATVVQALVLVWVLGRLAPDGLSFGAGFGYGTLLGVAFAAATSLGHRLFGQQGFFVWVIEVGADVVGLALAGVAIAAFI